MPKKCGAEERNCRAACLTLSTVYVVKCYDLTKAGESCAKLANYRFSEGILNQLQSKREGLQLATLEMYAGLWKHCMVIPSFIPFIVLISAVGWGGVLYLIWSQSIVLEDINLWEVLRLTSKLLPPFTF